jgi:apolipoprotein N-acyltransferase
VNNNIFVELYNKIMSILNNKFFLSILSGVLLWASWYPHGFVYIIFIAFVPLFIVSTKLIEKGNCLAFWQGFWISFPAFLIWNVGVTWWIWKSTPPGSIAAFILNTLFMSCVFASWHWVKRTNFSKTAVPLALVAFWCSWEFLHLNWQITWPWLNLGNVFASTPNLVHWYEYTGTFGGTIWVLAVNFLVYSVIQNGGTEIHKEKSVKILQSLRISVGSIIHLCAKKTFIVLIATLITPILISFILYKTYKIDKTTPLEAIVIQQNIDPWTEQYEKSNLELAQLLIETASSKTTPNTELIVCSESALSHTFREEQLHNLDIYPNAAFQFFDNLLCEYPRLNLITGLSTVAFFDSKVSSASRESFEGDFFEYYNSSCLYNRDTLVLYRKCRLVPGVEKMPYPKIFGFLEKLAVNLGGISGSLGVDTEQRVFPVNTQQGIVKVGAPICYESIFGELFSNFVKNGAQLMCVITNDAWWGNTPGYKQHFEMSRLRAIETRHYILRAANTGISAFIDPLGGVHQKTEYETRTSISQTVYLNSKTTFYTKHGDYLARLMLSISGVILFWVLLSTTVRKKLSLK